jgi:hypothetical protein
MPKKKSRHVDLVAVANLRNELQLFAEEFDITDPVQVGVNMDTHISSVLAAAPIKTGKKKPDLYLDNLLAYFLKVPEDHEIVVYAREFRTLISTYGGDPPEEDMEAAYELLTLIIELLNGVEGIREAHGQARIDFE